MKHSAFPSSQFDRAGSSFVGLRVLAVSISFAGNRCFICLLGGMNKSSPHVPLQFSFIVLFASSCIIALMTSALQPAMKSLLLIVTIYIF